MSVIVNPEPPLLPRLTSVAEIVSPISYPYPKSVIVTIATAPPETTIVAFAVSPSPLVVSGTFTYVPFE